MPNHYRRWNVLRRVRLIGLWGDPKIMGRDGAGADDKCEEKNSDGVDIGKFCHISNTERL